MSVMAFNDLSIERKLLRMSFLATLAALVLASVSFLTYDLFTFRQILGNRMAAFADIVGFNSASAILFNDAQSADHNLHSLILRRSITTAAIYTPDGKLFAQWSRQPVFAHFPAMPNIGEDERRFTSGSVEVFHPIWVDKSCVGTVYIRSDLSERDQRLKRYALIVLAVMGISFLLSSIISLSLGRRIAEPILDLVNVAQRVSQDKDYAVRAISTAGGEIGLLVNTFNDMLSQIQQRGQALQRANAELEEKVEERTNELRRKEEELNQSRRLESVGRLAGGIAHDFNNLLTGIIGCSEALEMDIPPNSPLAIEVQEIKRAGERASDLTRQLLAFGRKQIIAPKILDLNAQIRLTANLLRRLIREDIELILDLSPELNTIKADPGQIDQIIINIAVNSRDAMPHGGKIFIRTSNTRLDTESEALELPPGDYTMLTITDTGIGMTKDVQAHMFEPFYTTKEQGKGTGLGLATVYGIIKQNHGGIQVYSHPNMGTTFKVFLPQTGEGGTAPSEGTNPAMGKDNVPGGQETILLVEDEALVSNHVARLLRRKGYEVLVAASGKEALAILSQREKPVDLLLTDVVMPEMNGKQLVEKLHEVNPDLRVLYMSGYPAEVISQHGVLDTGIAFIEKPFHTEQICRKVREILDR